MRRKTSIAYTVGVQSSYDRALRDEPVVTKIGRHDGYPGEWIWQDVGDARRVADQGRLPDREDRVALAVYEVALPGSWGDCVSSEPDADGVHRLLRDARITRKVGDGAAVWRHRIKAWPIYFEAVWRGEKPFEIRCDDRGYAVGDVLEIEEWCPATSTRSGRVIAASVTYVMRGPVTHPQWRIPTGVVVLGIAVLGRRGPGCAERPAQHQYLDADQGLASLRAQNAELARENAALRAAIRALDCDESA